MQPFQQSMVLSVISKVQTAEDPDPIHELEYSTKTSKWFWTPFVLPKTSAPTGSDPWVLPECLWNWKHVLYHNPGGLCGPTKIKGTIFNVSLTLRAIYLIGPRKPRTESMHSLEYFKHRRLIRSQTYFFALKVKGNISNRIAGSGQLPAPPSPLPLLPNLVLVLLLAYPGNIHTWVL